MIKSELLRQVRGSMTHFEPLSEKNISKVAEEGLTMEEVRTVFAEAGLDANKIIVDPERVIYNVYYADFESGLYFEVVLSKDMLHSTHNGPAAYVRARADKKYLAERDWHSFYCIDVPTPLRIMDFQRRYKDIEPEAVFDVWAYIHTHIDYANDQWRTEVLSYVFEHAPKVENLPLNANGKVTVYRGCGALSQPLETALSWSTNRINALWFANHSGRGQALYEGEISPENVAAYFPDFRNENEVVVKANTVENIRKWDMIPVTQENMTALLVPVLRELTQFGACVADMGYERESIFEVHGWKHILRVLLLSLIYFYKSGEKLSERDKQILIYFSLLHDIGRTNEDKDDAHGKKSVQRIKADNLSIPGITLSSKEKDMAHLIIRYHSRADEDGFAAINAMRKLSSSEREHLKMLYCICKDVDGLDRVRFNGLDVAMLRTPYAVKLALVAGSLLHEDIEKFIDESKGE